MIYGIALGLFFFIPTYWIYFAVIRLTRKTDRFFTYGLIVWFFSTLALALFTDLMLGPKLLLLVTFTGLWTLALNVMAAIANSVTLCMLSELQTKASVGFSAEELKTTYQQRDAIRGRLLSIARAGLIEDASGAYTITSKGRIVALPFTVVKTIFGIRKMG